MREKVQKKSMPPWAIYLLVLLVVIVMSWLGLFYSHAKEEQDYAITKARANTLYQKQIYDESLDCYQTCRKIHPKDTDVAKRIAQIYYHTEKYDKAAEECHKLLEKKPKWESVQLLLARCYEKQENWALAADVLRGVEQSETADSMLRELKGKYTLDYKMMDWVMPWFSGKGNVLYCAAGKENRAEIDSAKGKTLFSGTFSYLGPKSESENLYPAKTGGQFLFVDEAGKRRLVPGEKFGFFGPFRDGFAVTEQDGKYGYIDRNFRKVHLEYEAAYPYVNGRAVVKKHGIYSIIDEKQRPLKQCAFTSLRQDAYREVSRYGVMIGKTKKGDQIFNPNGELLSDFAAEEIRFPEESKANLAFRKGDKWGFVTRYGQTLISPYFEDAKSFSRGYAAVKLNGKWGYIDETGRLVIPCQFKDAGPVTPQGTAWVENQAGYQLMKLLVYESK